MVPTGRSAKFELPGTHESLEVTIPTFRETQPVPHSDRATSPRTTANALCPRFEHSGQHEDFERRFHCIPKHPSSYMHRILADIPPATSRMRSGNDLSSPVDTKIWRRRFHFFEKHSGCYMHRILSDPPSSAPSPVRSRHSLGSPVDKKIWRKRLHCIEKQWNCDLHRIMIDPLP
jgi:hypothetical protein